MSSGTGLDGGGVGMGVMPPQLALLQMLEERAMHTTGEGAAPWGSGLGTETAFAHRQFLCREFLSVSLMRATQLLLFHI